jgi:hypothetical protein
MQSQPRFLTTSHRRQRLALWALAMLSWIAAVLFAGKQLTARQLRQRHRRLSLDGLVRLITQLIIVRAAELGRWRRHGRLRFWLHGRDLKRRHYIRSLIGSRLRRALNHKDLAARLRRLIHVLRHLDAFARQLSRRRLTRLWSIAPAPTPAATIFGAPAPSPAAADSS